MPTYDIPTNQVIREAAQDKIPLLSKNRRAFQILPERNIDSFVITWEQMDNYQGLMNVRGLGGQPGRVAAVGAKKFVVLPGVYGDVRTLDERILTERRKLGTFGTPIKVSDQVAKEQDYLLGRGIDRKEQLIWSLLALGSFSVAGQDGQILHTDTFPLQPFSATTPWSDHDDSTPVMDLQAMQLLNRGHSVEFNAMASFFVNRKYANHLINNRNPADLGGMRLPNGQNISSLAHVNVILEGQGLPKVEIFDGGYLNGSNVFVPFLADSKATLVGVRSDGQPIGYFANCMNATNPDSAPGDYWEVYEDPRPPKQIEVHHGFNGGPVIEYPSAVVAASI